MTAAAAIAKAGAVARRRPTPGLRKMAATRLTVAALLLWVLLLRPEMLGGPASYVLVSGHSMEPTLHTGDLVLALDQPSYRVGDVIVYRVPNGPGAGTFVIHRVVGGDAATGYVTQGDNRDTIDPWRPKPHDIAGALEATAPRVGFAFAFLRTPLGLALVAGLTAFAYARRRHASAADAARAASSPSRR